MFNDLNNYRQSIKLILELNQKRLLDTNLEFQNDMLTISVHCVETKLPTTWNSKIPEKYKSDVIIWELHRSKWKSTDFTKEKFTVKKKLKKQIFKLNL